MVGARWVDWTLWAWVLDKVLQCTYYSVLGSFTLAGARYPRFVCLQSGWQLIVTMWVLGDLVAVASAAAMPGQPSDPPQLAGLLLAIFTWISSNNARRRTLRVATWPILAVIRLLLYVLFLLLRVGHLPGAGYQLMGRLAARYASRTVPDATTDEQTRRAAWENSFFIAVAALEPIVLSNPPPHESVWRLGAHLEEAFASDAVADGSFPGVSLQLGCLFSNCQVRIFRTRSEFLIVVDLLMTWVSDVNNRCVGMRYWFKCLRKIVTRRPRTHSMALFWPRSIITGARIPTAGPCTSTIPGRTRLVNCAAIWL